MDAFECPFSAHSRSQPDAPALQRGKETWSYRKCQEWINGLVPSLRKLGITSGQCVAIYPDLSFLTPLLFFALFRMNATVFPLSDRLPFSIIANQLTLARPAFLFHPDQIAITHPAVKTISFSHFMRKTTPISHSLQSFLVKSHRATYLATSGTTTDPKIAVHSLGNHYYSALGSNGFLPSLTSGRWLLSLPLYHIAGIAILFRTFLAGATVVFPPSRSFHPEIIATENVSHLSLVPTQLYRLLDLPFRDTCAFIKHIKCLLLGGATIGKALYYRGLSHGYPLYPTYGMTEMSSQITTAIDKDIAFFSLGHPLPYRKCKVSSDGEIKVKGETLFQGYLSKKREAERFIDQNGYFTTRDLGHYSPQTGLIFLGRKDRLFISGGENIYPEEIERALLSIRGILDARVTPTYDREFGMRPIAHICSRSPIQPEKLQDTLKLVLPKYKIPIAFIPLSIDSPSIPN